MTPHDDQIASLRFTRPTLASAPQSGPDQAPPKSSCARAPSMAVADSAPLAAATVTNFLSAAMSPAAWIPGTLVCQLAST
jgi:hypothetical protein